MLCPKIKNAAEERRTKLLGILPAPIIAQKHGGSLRESYRSLCIHNEAPEDTLLTLARSFLTFIPNMGLS